MSNKRLKHDGVRVPWFMVRVVDRLAIRVDDLHSYLLRAKFDRCASCGIEDGYGHRNGCEFAQPPKIYRGRITSISKRPPLMLEGEDY